MGTFGDTNAERTTSIWRVSKALIGQAVVRDVKVTSYVPRLRSTFVSPKVSNVTSPLSVYSNEILIGFQVAVANVCFENSLITQMFQNILMKFIIKYL